MVNEELKLRAIAQIALTTHITPRVRSISLSVDSNNYKISFRVYTDGPMHETCLEALGCAVTEIIAAYDANWSVNEEYIPLPEPNQMEHLPLIVYLRCEDSWVFRGA